VRHPFDEFLRVDFPARPTGRYEAAVSPGQSVDGHDRGTYSAIDTAIANGSDDLLDVGVVQFGSAALAGA